MMAVADTFDAMTSTRAYRGAKSMEEALAELRRCSGTQFDPKMVEIFLQAIQEEDRYKAVTERIARDAWLARTPA
jgi:HD-GYP domain-containing protein (c-di-GMP phosphodiesterase class II)